MLVTAGPGSYNVLLKGMSVWGAGLRRVDQCTAPVMRQLPEQATVRGGGAVSA